MDNIKVIVCLDCAMAACAPDPDSHFLYYYGHEDGPPLLNIHLAAMEKLGADEVPDGEFQFAENFNLESECSLSRCEACRSSRAGSRYTVNIIPDQ